MINPLLDLFAREHPAFVHVPLGMVIVLPLAMAMSYRPKHSRAWKQTSFFIAAIGVAGSIVALFSGLFWGRQISLIPAGGLFPRITSAKQVLQKMLQLHEFAAVLGLTVGVVCLILIWRSLRGDLGVLHSGAIPHRRLLDRGVGVAAFCASLIWVGTWGFCGKLGGIMVFGNEETNRAAAAADESRRADVEADLPIRALDYASLEPAQTRLFRSKAHGNRWVRAWVTASAFDAYKEGKDLPPGSYTVLSSFEDAKGKPAQEPGPLFMRETLANGQQAFVFYWPRVPESKRSETGGEDSVYWRSPSPKLASCAVCHAGAGPAKGAGMPVLKLAVKDTEP